MVKFNKVKNKCKKATVHLRTFFAKNILFKNEYSVFSGKSFSYL